MHTHMAGKTWKQLLTLTQTAKGRITTGGLGKRLVQRFKVWVCDRYVRTETRIYPDTPRHTNRHTNIDVHIRIHMHVHMHKHMHTRIHIHIRIRMHIHMHTHMHTHMHIHMHTGTMIARRPTTRCVLSMMSLTTSSFRGKHQLE